MYHGELWMYGVYDNRAHVEKESGEIYGDQTHLLSERDLWKYFGFNYDSGLIICAYVLD